MSYGPEWKTPQDFGAVGDGVTDDRAAFQLAADDPYPTYVPWTPAGYAIGSRIRLPVGKIFLGAPNKPRLKLLTNDWLFEVAGAEVEVGSFRADFGHLSSGNGVLLRTDENHLERVIVHDFIMAGANCIVSDMPSATYRAVLLTIKDIIGYALKGTGIHLQRSFAYQRCERLTMLPTATNNSPAFYSIGNEGSFWVQCDATGGNVHAGNAGAHGFQFDNCKAVWMGQCMADMIGGGGFFLNNCEYFYGSQLVASMVGTIGISVNSSRKVTLSACNVGGRAGMPYAPGHPDLAVGNSPGTIIDDACRVYNSSALPISIVGSPGTRNNALVGL